MHVLDETRSGVILFRIEDSLKGGKEHEPFEMHVTWDDISGIRNKDIQTLCFQNCSPSSSSAFSSSSSSTTTTTTTTSSSAPSAPPQEEVEKKEEREESKYGGSGVRKAILLVRFTDFYKRYIDLRSSDTTDDTIALFEVCLSLSIIIIFFLFCFVHCIN